jgi:hypothetical protein
MGLFNFLGLGKIIETGKEIADELHLSEEEKLKYMIEKEKLKLQEEELELKEKELYLKDIENSRQMYSDISTSDKAPFINKIFPPILATITIIATFALFFLFTQGKFEGASKDIVIYILGVLSAITTQIYSFFFGSSQGSKEKTDILKDKINRNF